MSSTQTGKCSSLPVSVWIIANPMAGGHYGRKRLDEAIRLLQSRLPVEEVRWTKKRGDAGLWAREARERGIGGIFGAGGDGTLNEIANGIACSDVVFGVLPCGTANVIACEIGLPLDPVRSAGRLLAGKVERVHLGRAKFKPVENNSPADGSDSESDCYFLFAAGIGFDAYVCHKINIPFKNVARKAAYVVDGLRLFLHYKSPRLSVVLDGGEPIACSELIVCNTRAYAGRLFVSPTASLHEPRLDVCLMQRPGRHNLARYAIGIALGQHTKFGDVAIRKAESIEVRAENAAYLQIDGDGVGFTPARFTVERGALSLIIPSSKQAK